MPCTHMKDYTCKKPVRPHTKHIKVSRAQDAARATQRCGHFCYFSLQIISKIGEKKKMEEDGMQGDNFLGDKHSWKSMTGK